MAGGLPISCTGKEIQTFITWWLCHCSCLPSGFPSWVSPLSSSFQSTTHSTPKVNSLKQCFHQIHLTRTHKESILILSFLTSVPKMGKWTDCDLPIQSPVVRTPAPSEPPGHHIHVTSLISFQTNKKPKNNKKYVGKHFQCSIKSVPDLLYLFLMLYQHRLEELMEVIWPYFTHRTEVNSTIYIKLLPYYM